MTEAQLAALKTYIRAVAQETVKDYVGRPSPAYGRHREKTEVALDKIMKGLTEP